MFEYCYGLTSLDLSNFDTSKVTSMNEMFYYCTNLTSITFGYYGDISNVTSYSYMFTNVPSTCTLTLCENTRESWYKLLNKVSPKPSNITYINCYIPTVCTSLNITALDVSGRKTTTPITYTAVTNGVDNDGNIMNDVIVTGTAESASFEQNTSYTDEIVRTITFEYMGVTTSTTITQGVWVDREYSINLNNQWRLSSNYPNFEPDNYDGIYESFSNKGVLGSSATCIITIDGYENFTLYIGSYASSGDYTNAYYIDSTQYITSTTSSYQYMPTNINNFKKVEYTNLGGSIHTIRITFRKSSSNYYITNDDRGYLLIPKNQ